MVLCSNDSSRAFISAATESGKLGWLMGPTHFKNPKQGIPFALDNDGFINWTKKTPFNELRWIEMLERVKQTGLSPIWILVPDSVADRKGTLLKWREYYNVAKSYEWPLAFAVQDGMTVSDVPKEADVVFVGGSTEWKWWTVKMWCDSFPRVHVGRVNGIRQLWICQDYGAESCDGSGFFREGFHGKRANGLKVWLHLKTNPQKELFVL